MTEREKLIDFLQNVPADYEGNRGVETIANYLLENGVIVPLINEADTVYVVLLNKVFKFDIISVNLFQNRLIYKGQHGLNLSYTFRPRDIGKTVFLTREEAEKALKEREEND